MEQAVIVGCGMTKVWKSKPEVGRVCARDAYVSTLARLSMEYAEELGHPWYILSAKYGLMSPGFMIEGPYEVTFMDESTGPLKAEELVVQIKETGLHRIDRVTLLAGPEYYLVLRLGFSYARALGEIVCPMKRLRIGQRNQWLKRHIEQQQQLHE